MARLHEYQGKKLLADIGFNIPRGELATTPDKAAQITQQLIEQGAASVVLKIQAWTTGRKAIGGIRFAQTPDSAREHAQQLLNMHVGNFAVEYILVEEKLNITDELFVSLSIDDAARQPVILLALSGGTGIEQRADHVHKIPVNITTGPDNITLKSIINNSKINPALYDQIFTAVDNVYKLAAKIEARSIEINPLVITDKNQIIAADCRMTIDDYAVARHPELGIRIARELDHPPTRLEQIAYNIEQYDHRGTFYFAQLPTDPHKPVIGFHGAGGGGSMMSMDAVTQAGFTVANFTDTSGNPSSAKVYCAARIILQQPNLVGYFGSGSGVASQEQFHSAYGLAKAFIEMNMAIPAVIRLGGNSEDRAVEILEDACKNLPATVKGYKKDDTPFLCARHFTELVNNSTRTLTNMHRNIPSFVNSQNAYSFPIKSGTVWIDYPNCTPEITSIIIKNSSMLLKADENHKPVLAVSEEDIANKDSELIACEIECFRADRPVFFVDIPIEGIDM